LISEDSNLIGEVGNGGLGISKSSLKRRNFSSSSVKLSSEVSNLSRKLGILVGKYHNLVVKVGNGGLGIGKSSE
jgi:hypothetical protein